MNVALLGYGTVGQGVYELLAKHHKHIVVKYVFLRDINKAHGVDSIVTANFRQIIEDDSIDTVIELIGGKTDAYTYVLQALQAKKHVVTANKALISEHFRELTECAKSNGVRLLYEASVGGGILVLNPLKTISYTNPIINIQGIINGSTNYILSKIFLEDYKLEKALEEARALGYIETGTNDDLDGLDLLRKINILSMIAYHQIIQEEDIIRLPLSSITEAYYAYIKSKGLMMKYIATSSLNDYQLQIHLEPVIIGRDNEFASIHYEENLILITDERGKQQSFQGLGAGRYPTAGAVIQDLFLLQEHRNLGIIYDSHYPINQGSEQTVFLIQKGTQFIKTEPISFQELLQQTDIQGIARIDASIIELL